MNQPSAAHFIPVTRRSDQLYQRHNWGQETTVRSYDNTIHNFNNCYFHTPGSTETALSSCEDVLSHFPLSILILWVKKFIKSSPSMATAPETNSSCCFLQPQKDNRQFWSYGWPFFKLWEPCGSGSTPLPFQPLCLIWTWRGTKGWNVAQSHGGFCLCHQCPNKDLAFVECYLILTYLNSYILINDLKYDRLLNKVRYSYKLAPETC